MRRASFVLIGLICAQWLAVSKAWGQSNSYKQTNLVSDTQGLAPVMDANLVNPWGICIIPGDPFWISDNSSTTGVTTLYSKTGMLQGTFKVAPPKGSSNPATPTGCVGNTAGAFLAGGASSAFIFDTEDGTISGWTGGVSSVLVVDNSANPTAATGAVYKGLALLTNSQGNFLLATNFRSGSVEVYDSTFKLTNLTGTFTDPNPPSVPAGSGSPGYAAFGIHTVTVNNAQMVVVTYALQDAPKHDPMNIAGSGFADLYDGDGNFVRRLASGSHMNSPWGAVIPPASFGALGGKLLVGNFGDGTINAFDFNAGTFIDTMKDANGAAIVNGSLWDMVFDPAGKTGDPNTMYLTAGLANEMHGLFAAITANATPAAPAPDFSIGASPSSMTISAGQTAQYTITLGGLNGFNGAVALTCSGQPLGSACSFAQSSLSPASGGMATTMMTISTSSSPYMPAVAVSGTDGRTYAMLLAVPVLVLFGIYVLRSPQTKALERRKRTRSWVVGFALLLLTGCVLASGGCSYKAPAGMGTGTQRGTTTVMVSGTSGSLSHSTSVSITVQ
ncbi:MAG TPA: TIGR03118 family protein [Candidatus Methylomirabilis sp.]|nr:TIGR03118 family protein [Candidatus Methylomirabilis sp.]